MSFPCFKESYDEKETAEYFDNFALDRFRFSLKIKTELGHGNKESHSLYGKLADNASVYVPIYNFCHRISGVFSAAFLGLYTVHIFHLRNARHLKSNLRAK